VKLFGRKKEGEEKDKYAGLEALYKAHQREWKRMVQVVVDRHMQLIHEPGGREQAAREGDFAEFGMKRTYLEALDDIQFEVLGQALFPERANPRKGGVVGTGLGEALQRWAVTGIHNRPLLGIPPSGERLQINGVTHLIVRNDLVRSSWTYWELPELTRQMASR
jgi:SnoaL-like polyketide cyclase